MIDTKENKFSIAVNIFIKILSHKYFLYGGTNRLSKRKNSFIFIILYKKAAKVN